MELDFNVWTILASAFGIISTVAGVFWKKLVAFVKFLRTEVFPQLRDLTSELVDVVESGENVVKEAVDVVEIVLKSIEDGTIGTRQDEIKTEIEQLKKASADLKVQAQEAKDEISETIKVIF